MKNYIYLSVLLFLFIAGCNKPYSPPVKEQYKRYIFFSEGVKTKASLVVGPEDLYGKTIGVVGFKYDNTKSWNELVAPTPNVFCDENDQLVDVEDCHVDASSAMCTYSPLQGWSNAKKYTFFAYYPYGPETITLVNLDGTQYTEGTPAIKYTIDQEDLGSSMVDVMTAFHTDKYWYSATDNNVENGDVPFEFIHRLSCLGVHIKNSSSGEIGVVSASLTISGIKNNQVIIPLNGASATNIAATEPMSATLSLSIPEGKSVSAGKEKELSDKLIFIPQEDQEDELSVQLTITYVRKAVDGFSEYTDSFETAPLTTTLVEGQKHLIHLNFTDSTVDIEGIGKDEWNEQTPVEDTFN